MNGLKVTGVERITLDVPFKERIAPWNELLVLQWRVVELIRLTTDDPDVVGWGETLPYYTWGRVPEAVVERATGSRLFDLLGDDSLGAGLQMAVYDAAGKALGVPISRLFHLPQVRAWCPLAWWNHDMPAELLAAEAQDAVAAGYTAHKMKGRPWIDLFGQVEAIGAVTPPHYRIDIDWNDTLLNVGNAAPVLTELETYERVALFEGPIPQRDIEGYRHLRSKVKKPLALHFGLPPFPTTARAEVCDGFVVAGGISRILQEGTLAAAFEKSLFLQMVGTGLVTAQMAHLGSVLSAARWPAVTCLNNYEDDLLVEPLTISGGYVQVPEGPGLGVTVDETALERYRVEGVAAGTDYRIPRPPSILSVVWPGGRVMHYAAMRHDALEQSDVHFAHLQHAEGRYSLSRQQLWEDFLSGNQPVTDRGVQLEVWRDDGTSEWRDLYERTLRGPVRDRR